MGGTRSERAEIVVIALALFTTFACFVALAIAVGRAIPVKRTETVAYITHHTVVTDHLTRNLTKDLELVVPVPSKVRYAPLATPTDACNGHPVVVIDKDEGESTSQDGRTYTWVVVRPAGDEYRVSCYLEGTYGWKTGDLVVLYGTPRSSVKERR